MFNDFFKHNIKHNISIFQLIPFKAFDWEVVCMYIGSIINKYYFILLTYI